VPSLVEGLFAPPAEVAAHPAVAAACLGAELLEPHAAAADDPRRGVAPERLAALAEAGLYSIKVPTELGGFGADDRVDAEVVELIAASCAASWFVMTQHRLPAALVCDPLAGLPEGSAQAGPSVAAHRKELSRARRRAGIAVAHIRRPGPPAIRAEPDGRGGYLLRGRADWCTGWGLIDAVLVAAAAPGDRLVFALKPATTQPGLRASDPLPLAVMGGTRTVALELDGLTVAAEDVLLTVSAPTWHRVDLHRTANTTPAMLGLLRRALVELERLGRERDRPAAFELAHRLAAPAARLRQRAYRLLTEVPAELAVNERTALRGQLSELTVRATHALIAARAGSAMLLSSPEQRWAREAAFYLVQAQTDAVRTAQLAAFEP
jgi:alkylation response protein AidB-like acyl-CoA dehydrogenase